MKHFKKYPFLSFLILSLLPALLHSADIEAMDALRAFDTKTDTGGLKNSILEKMRNPESDVSWSDDLLALILDDKASPSGRELACQLLMGAPAPAHVLDLGSLLSNPLLSHPVRMVLTPISGDEIDEVFMQALNLCKGEFQHGIITSLSERQVIGSVQALITLSKTTDDFLITAHCLRAIARIGGELALDFLTDLPSFEWNSVRHAYGEAIVLLLDSSSTEMSSKTKKKLVKFLLHKSNTYAIRYAGMREALQLKPGNYKQVLGYMSSTDPKIRDMGASVIALLDRDETVIKGLIEGADGLEVSAQIQLIEGLAAIHVPEVLSYARVILYGTSNSLLRESCLRVIGQMGSVKDAMQIAEWLLDAEKDEKKLIQEIIVMIPDSEVDAWLLESFKTAENTTQKLFVDMIAQRGLRDLIPELFAQLDLVSASVKSAIYKTIGRLGILEHVEVLYGKRSHIDQTERNVLDRAIVDISRRIPGDGGSEFLIGRYRASSLAQQPQLLKMIGAIGNLSSLEFLKPLLDQDKPDSVAFRSMLTWRGLTGFDQLEIMSNREDLDLMIRNKCWDAVLRLAVSAQETWDGDRMLYTERAYAATPTDASVVKLIKAMSKYQRGDVLEWLGEGRLEPNSGSVFAEAYEAMAKSMGE